MFTMINKCKYTVWPGILSNAGVDQLSITGFSLQNGESRPVATPPNWAGRFWGRTSCSTDFSSQFSCKTGACVSGRIECFGAGAKPPASLAEFTLNEQGLDFYDVSLVDGYNLPMLVTPQGVTGDKCTMTGCAVDLNGMCPPELRLSDGRSTVACRSASEAFNSPQYCCSGAYGSPDTCRPSNYSRLFKNACPRAYSFAYDDHTSTFTCTGSPDYTITFCPETSTRQRTSSGINCTTNGDGALDGSSSPHTCRRMVCSNLIGLLIIIVAICQSWIT